MKEQYCKMLPFWDKLTARGKEKFCDSLTPHSYFSGERVHGGENCNVVIFIVSGCLRVYMISEEWRDVTLYRLYKGDVCMLSASCVLSEITFDVYVDAEEDCDCYVIRGSVFSQIAQEERDLKMFAYETALTRFSEVIWVIQKIMFMRADKRLAVFLWDEMLRTGSEVIALTQEHIAKYISSAREVVSGTLKYFVGECIVEVARKGVQQIKRDCRRLRYHNYLCDAVTDGRKKMC